jgi:hypothetical protein
MSVLLDFNHLTDRDDPSPHSNDNPHSVIATRTSSHTVLLDVSVFFESHSGKKISNVMVMR